MTRDSLEIHQWISTVHSFIEITLKVTILQNVIIFSYMLWKFLLGVLHIMARMKRLVWLLDHKLHWLLFKVLMAQEGDRVPAVEGQVCLVRWVSCGDRKEQISISQNTKHALITCRIRPSQFIERNQGKWQRGSVGLLQRQYGQQNLVHYEVHAPIFNQRKRDHYQILQHAPTVR